MNRHDGRAVRVIAVWWVIVTALGELLVAALIRAYPVVASREGAVSDESIFYLLRFVVPIGALVIITLVYSAARFRAAPGEQGDAAVQTRRAGWVWVWLTISASLTVSFILQPGVTGLTKIWKTQGASDALTIEVTARQWEWRFSYPELGVTDATTLMLPVDRPVDLVITSDDVIHSFWVPALRIKKDAIPGETRHLFLTPDRLLASEEDPMMRVQCAELCGIGHARMRTDARIVSVEDFEAWVNTRAGNMGAVGRRPAPLAGLSVDALAPSREGRP